MADYAFRCSAAHAITMCFQPELLVLPGSGLLLEPVTTALLMACLLQAQMLPVHTA